MNKENVHSISKCLSVKVDSPASIINMRDSFSFKKIITRTYNTMSFPDNLPKEFLIYWEKYVDLCRELLDSSNFPVVID